MQGPEVRSGDLTEPVELVPGDEWTFTITEGEAGAGRRISVNYDGFVDDVSVGDELLVDGGIQAFKITAISGADVTCEARAAAAAGPLRFQPLLMACRERAAAACLLGQTLSGAIDTPG